MQYLHQIKNFQSPEEHSDTPKKNDYKLVQKILKSDFFSR